MANSYRLFSKFCKVATTPAGSTTTPVAGGTPNVQHTTGASNPAGAQSTTPQTGQTGNAQQTQNNITFRGNHTVNADLSNVDWRNRATSENSTTNIGGMWLHDKDVEAFTGMRDQLQQSYVNRGFSAADARLKASQRTAQYWDDQYRLASGGKARNEWQSKPRVAKQPAADPEAPAEQPAATPEGQSSGALTPYTTSLDSTAAASNYLTSTYRPPAAGGQEGLSGAFTMGGGNLSITGQEQPVNTAGQPVTPAATPTPTATAVEQPVNTERQPVGAEGQPVDDEDLADNDLAALNNKANVENVNNAANANKPQADQGAVAKYNAEAKARIESGEDPEAVLRDVAYGNYDRILQQYGYNKGQLVPAVDADGKKIPGVFITTDNHRYVGWNGDHLVHIKNRDGKFLATTAGNNNYVARNPLLGRSDLSQYLEVFHRSMYPRAAATLGYHQKANSGPFDRLYSNDAGATLDLYRNKWMDNNAEPVATFGRAFATPIEHNPYFGLGTNNFTGPFTWGEVIEYPKQQ